MTTYTEVSGVNKHWLLSNKVGWRRVICMKKVDKIGFFLWIHILCSNNLKGLREKEGKVGVSLQNLTGKQKF